MSTPLVRRRRSKKKNRLTCRQMAVYRPFTNTRPFIYPVRQVITGSQLQFLSSALTTYNGHASYVQQNASTATSWAFGFCLTDLANVSTYASLFDQYRFVKVQVNLRPVLTSQSTALVTYSNVTPGTTPTTPQGAVYTCVDYDDYVASSVSAIKEYDNCKIQLCNAPGVISRNILPRCVGAAMTTSSYTPIGYTQQPKGTWLDISNTAIPYFGFKVGIDVGTTSYLQSWLVDMVYWVQFKRVR